jgi:large subunit ribosomal protein L24
LQARQVRGALRLGVNEVAFDDVEGTLGGGRAKAQFSLKRGSEGLEARGQIALIGADAAAVLQNDGRPVVSGQLGLQVDYEGSGLSPASLIGSLSGTGLLTLENAQLTALDSRAFRAAIRAADQSVALDASKVRDVVATVLDGGALNVPRLDAPLTINAGQARIGPTIAQGQGADLTITGSADLSDLSLDARLTLTGPVIEGTTTRPDILVTLKGPLTTPKRTIDVSALSGFLMLRAVERQSRQIDSIEQDRRDAERREADRREAERKEAERRANESASVPPPTPAALPTEPAIEDAPSAAPVAPPRASRPRPAQPQAMPQPPGSANRPPPLPPPLNIGPAPGASAKPAPKSAQQPQSPPPAPRSALDVLFGVQR